MLNYRLRLDPTSAQREQLAWTLDTCRKVYNHFLHRLNRVEDTSKYGESNRLPKLKKWWTDLQDVHSKVLQKVVERLYDNLSTLKGLMELDGNSRNRASAAWGTFRRMLAYKCEREGTHFAEVRPHGTTKECARCGAETDKPLWVREHSCPACGFTADRDENAAWNVQQRGLDRVGTGTAESTWFERAKLFRHHERRGAPFERPAETAVPTATAVSTVAANHVAETGSPVCSRRRSRRSHGP